MDVKFLTKSALIAALYVVLTEVFQAISFTKDQFRVSEILILLVILNSKYIIGLSLGTFIANMIGSPFGIVDAFCGTLTSFIVMIIIIFFAKFLKSYILYFVSAVIAAFLNGLYVPFIFTILDGENNPISGFLPFFISVFFGEFVVVMIVGTIMMFAINKNASIKKMIENI